MSVEPMSLATPLAYALAYAQLGWHVLPIEPRAKVPIGRLVPRGMLDASTDPEDIRKWWKASPDAGIGIALAASGLVAIDVDPRNGGTDSFEDLQARHGSLRSDVMAYTGGGGEHHVFLIPSGTQVSLPGILGPGVDVKANGYIVVEPSLHPSGNAYCWEASSSPLDGVVPSPLPDWLRNLRPAAAKLQKDEAGRVVTGGRNEHLSRRAFTLRKAGLPIVDIEDVLLRINARECSPPLDDAEVRQIAQRKVIVQPDPAITFGTPPTPAAAVQEDGLLPLLTLEELQQQAQDVSWLVKGVIPADSVGMFFGASGTFKSFIALDLALHIVHGMQWLRRKTRRAPVIWIAAEGGAGTWKRIEAWHREHGIIWQGAPIYVVPVALDLAQEAYRVVEAVKAKLPGVTPGAIFVDTLSQTFAGEENSASEMSAYLRQVGLWLRAEWQAAVLLVHHSGHNQHERPRGSSAIRANIDFLFGVHRDEKEMLATLSAAKQKDGELIEDQMFALSVFELGKDADGDLKTSLVARAVMNEAEKQELVRHEASKGRGGQNALILELAQNGQEEKALRMAFYERCTADTADSRRQAYHRARGWAVKSGFMEFKDGYVLLLGSA